MGSQNYEQQQYALNLADKSRRLVHASGAQSPGSVAPNNFDTRRIAGQHEPDRREMVVTPSLLLRTISLSPSRLPPRSPPRGLRLRRRSSRDLSLRGDRLRLHPCVMLSCSAWVSMAYLVRLMSSSSPSRVVLRNVFSQLLEKLIT